MDERRTGARIIADAADLVAHADAAQLGQGNAGNVEVHRAAKHVLALLGNAGVGGTRTQHGVGCRRTISGDDGDILARTGGAINLPDQVEQARVHLGRLVTAPVPQENIQLLQALRIEATISLEDDFGLFTGMNVIKLERAGFSRCLRRRQRQDNRSDGKGRRSGHRYLHRGLYSGPNLRKARFNGRYAVHRIVSPYRFPPPEAFSRLPSGLSLWCHKKPASQFRLNSDCRI